MTRTDFLKLSAAAALSTAATAQNQHPDRDLGFTDTPMLPGMPWHVHDPARPHPKVVVPASCPALRLPTPSSCSMARIFPTGVQHGTGRRSREDGRTGMEARGRILRSGGQLGRPADSRKVRRLQVHVEWASPANAYGTSQGRGNSGVILMSRYEIQVLDMLGQPDIRGRQTAAIYGQWPPLVNPARSRASGTPTTSCSKRRDSRRQVAKPAFVTVFYNGVMVHNHKEILGPMVYRQVAHYTPAAGRRAANAAGSPRPGAVPQYLDTAAGGYDQPE